MSVSLKYMLLSAFLSTDAKANPAQNLLQFCIVNFTYFSDETRNVEGFDLATIGGTVFGKIVC
jgi:hypothetical protein